MLVDIVSKGGNFLLNVGPSPEGDFDQEAYKRLEEIGKWMKINSEAIYGSRPIEPYKDGKVRLTAKSDGSLYIIYVADDHEQELPSSIKVSGLKNDAPLRCILLWTNVQLPVEAKGDDLLITIPYQYRSKPPSAYAWVFQCTKSQ
jgi:alpha-L-fucosidase